MSEPSRAAMDAARNLWIKYYGTRPCPGGFQTQIEQANAQIIDAAMEPERAAAEKLRISACWYARYMEGCGSADLAKKVRADIATYEKAVKP